MGTPTARRAGRGPGGRLLRPAPGRPGVVPVLAVVIGLVLLTPVAAAAAGGSSAAVQGSSAGPLVPGAALRVAPGHALAGTPPAADVAPGALPETDTAVRSREAPPLEVLLAAAAIGLGVALYRSRRRRRPD